MKRAIGSIVCVLMVCGTSFAQAAPNPKATTAAATTSPAKSDPKTASQAGKPGGSADLDHVLADMDRAAAGFKSAQADFVWDQFSKVVNDHDFQKGVIYYRVAEKEKEVQMAADIK